MSKEETWHRIVIPCGIEPRELLSNFLFEHGAAGVEEQDKALVGYLPADLSTDQLLQSLEKATHQWQNTEPGIGVPEISPIAHQDWGESWRAHFRPVAVTDTLTVKPPWEDVEFRSDQIVIDIMPQMAFGTGTHETTQLCLIFLESLIRKNMTVLDVGTGSAILSVYAAKLGADAVLGVDIDPDAIENAIENVTTNRVGDRVAVQVGGLEDVPKQPYDLILMNILKSVLMQKIPLLKSYCHNNTRIVLSGILNTETDEMTRFVRQQGYRIVEQQQKGEWVGFVIGKDIEK